MDRNYLLTYEKEIKILGVSQGIIKTYEWFEDEEEMNIFTEENSIKPIEKLCIKSADDLT
jgi:hypothetical protein